MIEYLYDKKYESEDDFAERSYENETILRIDGLWMDIFEQPQLRQKIISVGTGKELQEFYVGNKPPYENQVFPGQQYDGIRITTTNHVIIAYISPYRDCCEIFGSILSQEDLSPYIGHKLNKMYLTNTACKTEYIDYILSRKSSSSQFYRIQFINFETDKGTFQFTVYNADNGYYGHDVVISIDSVTAYKNTLGGDCRRYK